jgi:hypothetical protein
MFTLQLIFHQLILKIKVQHNNINVTVISLLIKRDAFILAEQHMQIQCTTDWYCWGKTGKCPFTCCLFSSVIMQFCVAHKFLIQTGLCSRSISYMKWSVTVVMAGDYPILCGPCMNINILLFRCNINNVMTCHLLFVLECTWSHSHCDRSIPMKNWCLQSVLHEINCIESLIWYILNQQFSVQNI